MSEDVRAAGPQMGADQLTLWAPDWTSSRLAEQASCGRVARRPCCRSASGLDARSRQPRNVRSGGDARLVL